MGVLRKLCRSFSGVLLMGLAAQGASAEVRLARLFSDQAVLQRDRPIVVWGWGDPGETLYVTFRGARVRTRVDRGGRWQATLAAAPAGGPHELRVSGRHQEVVQRGILMGDVWLASGQSNMQYPLLNDQGFGGVKNAAEELKSADFPQLRLFQVARTQSTVVRPDVTSVGWQAATPQTVAPFSAVAFLFARELTVRYKIPIGIIEADWGGTPIRTWMSAQSLRDFPQYEQILAREARVDAAAERDYARYLRQRDAWYLQHAAEDRGRIGDTALWAAADYDDSQWPRVLEPRPWPDKGPKDFDGTVWLRKDIELSASSAAQPARLHLCALLQGDVSYVNGQRVGETTGETQERDYAVPAGHLRAGRNVIAIRLTGAHQSGDGFVGMHGAATDLYLQAGQERVMLAGEWRTAAGPDLSELPLPPAAAEFYVPYPQAPTLLYNSMIAPLSRFELKGILWYQGEGDVSRAAEYRRLFPAMINDWRAARHRPTPFLFVQLAGFGRDPDEPADPPLAHLRAAQAAALVLPDVAMAVATDVGERGDIHPSNKRPVAHRLALAAARLAYAEPIDASGPQVVSQRIEQSAIRLYFSAASRSLGTRDGLPVLRGFAIAGDDRVFRWADATIEGTTVVVRSADVARPTIVRYDWRNTPDGNLTDQSGLPSAPFESDASPVLERAPSPFP